MRQLFVMTNGRFNDLMNSLTKVSRPALKQNSTHGVLGKYDKATAISVADAISRDGFYVFEFLGFIDRDRETNTRGVSTNGGIDANYFTTIIQQRATGVAGVNGCVCLQKVEALVRNPHLSR